MGAHILAVEDTPHNLDLMTYLLEASGHRVTQATTGRDGLSSAISVRPDLIVLDLQLPDMDGFQVLEALRAEPRLNAVPVVAVTAYAMVGDRDHALRAGFDGDLSKPLEPESFVKSIEVYLPAELRGTPMRPNWQREDGSESGPSNGDAARARQILATQIGALNLTAVRSALEPHGYRLVAVDTVGQAREEATAGRPDVVLVEIEQPGPGPSVLTRLQRMPQLDGVPIAVLATEDQLGDLRDPALAVITSPIDPAVLLTRLDELTDSRQS